MSSRSSRFRRRRAGSLDAVGLAPVRRRAMLEIVEPLAPLVEERRLFYLLAAIRCDRPRSSIKEPIEI
jgi:hypothetical protein